MVCAQVDGQADGQDSQPAEELLRCCCSCVRGRTRSESRSVAPDPGRSPHLSVFDRPPTQPDNPQERFGLQALLDGRTGQDVDPSTVRLALVDGDRRAFVALGAPDQIYLATFDSAGGGVCGAPLSFLGDNGVVCLKVSSNRLGSYVAGIVDDEVTAVHVGGREAVLQNNVFLIDTASFGDPIVIITDGGSRDVTPQLPFGGRLPPR